MIRRPAALHAAAQASAGGRILAVSQVGMDRILNIQVNRWTKWATIRPKPLRWRLWASFQPDFSRQRTGGSSTAPGASPRDQPVSRGAAAFALSAAAGAGKTRRALCRLGADRSGAVKGRGAKRWIRRFWARFPCVSTQPAGRSYRFMMDVKSAAGGLDRGIWRPLRMI